MYVFYILPDRIEDLPDRCDCILSDERSERKITAELSEASLWRSSGGGRDSPAPPKSEPKADFADDFAERDPAVRRGERGSAAWSFFESEDRSVSSSFCVASCERPERMLRARRETAFRNRGKRPAAFE